MIVDNNIPAIVQSKISLSAATVKLWENAAWTVEQAQKKFLKAYEASLVDVLGKDWHKKTNDPGFSELIGEVESVMEGLCKAGGMTATVFNRYKTAARKAVLLGVSFRFGNAFSISQIRQAQAAAAAAPCEQKEKKVNEAFREMREAKKQKNASSVLKKVATVLPLPADGDVAADYIADVGVMLADHMQSVKQKIGKDAARALLAKMLDALDDQPDTTPIEEK